MSSSRRPSSSDSSSKNVRSDSSTLRPLAAKVRPIAPRPPVNNSPVIVTQSIQRSASSLCTVCSKRDCALSTHKSFRSGLARIDSSGNEHSTLGDRRLESGFTASYAFTLSQQYMDRPLASTNNGVMHKLPIKSELNTPEMHQLFRDFFVNESQTNFKIPQPKEMASDLVLSPFLIPALHDSALCLSVLATAAAIIPTRSAKPARNVTSLTLIGETMQEMRERIAVDPQQISDVTIVAATFLWLVNAWLEDLDAINSHATSVVTFVSSRGGLGELGMVGTVAQFIRWTDVLSSLITGQECRFPGDGDAVPDVITISQHSGTFWDISQAQMINSVHPAVAATCQATSKLMDFVELATNKGMTARDYLHVVQRLCLISQKDSYVCGKLRGPNSLDECILLAVSLIRIKSFCGNSYLLSVLTLRGAVALAEALRRLTDDLTLWQAHPNLLIWLLFALLIVDSDFNGRDWATAMLSQAITSKLGPPLNWPPSWAQDINQSLLSFVWSNLQLSSEFQATCKVIARTHGLHFLEDGEVTF